MDNSANPDLSVIVVTLVGAGPLRRCLAALAAQEDAPVMEIIVPADEKLGETAVLQQEFPVVQFLSLAGRRTYAELRALGVQKARAGVVAITEDHCLPNPRWCCEIMTAHETNPAAAIGGPVAKEAPDAPLNWAIYFADYLRYAPPVTAGETHELTDLNVTYKRTALAKIGEVWAAEFHENAVHAALAANGETLWLAPELAVNQRRQMTLGQALRDRYAFGRLFASTRVQMGSAGQRLVYVATAVLVPFLLTWRVFGLIRQKGRRQAEFWRALPHLLLVNSAWAFGEFVGYLTGKPTDLP